MTSKHGSGSRVVTHLPLDNDVGGPGSDVSLSGQNKPMLLETRVLLHDARSHNSSRSDQDLVDAARSGSRTAFNELWNLYSHRIYSSTLKIVKNPHDAEDAAQDAFLRAFLAIEKFEGRSSFYVWLTRIAINSALGILRKRRRRSETSLDSTSQQEGHSSPESLRDLAPGPEQVLDQQQRHACFAQAMQKLPAGLRDVVRTLITEDCTVKEAARRLDISYVAAKSRLYRAQAKMSSSTAARYGPIRHNAMPDRHETLPSGCGPSYL